MESKITGFHPDEAGHWVAELDCGHAQHVRHQPPFQLRPWTQTEEGRRGKLGAALECPLCEVPSLPEDAVEYQRTAVFTERSVPAGLLRDHQTKPEVWAKIVVEEGELEYRIAPSPRAHLLSRARCGVAAPGALHSVRPVGPVRFYVAFHRRRGAV